MPSYLALSGVCAIVMPPTARTSRMPAAPSAPCPTARRRSAARPALSASDRKQLVDRMECGRSRPRRQVEPPFPARRRSCPAGGAWTGRYERRAVDGFLRRRGAVWCWRSCDHHAGAPAPDAGTIRYAAFTRSGRAASAARTHSRRRRTPRRRRARVVQQRRPGQVSVRWKFLGGYGLRVASACVIARAHSNGLSDLERASRRLVSRASHLDLGALGATRMARSTSARSSNGRAWTVVRVPPHCGEAAAVARGPREAIAATRAPQAAQRVQRTCSSRPSGAPGFIVRGRERMPRWVTGAGRRRSVIPDERRRIRAHDTAAGPAGGGVPRKPGRKNSARRRSCGRPRVPRSRSCVSAPARGRARPPLQAGRDPADLGRALAGMPSCLRGLGVGRTATPHAVDGRNASPCTPCPSPRKESPRRGRVLACADRNGSIAGREAVLAGPCPDRAAAAAHQEMMIGGAT
jgi:hypothetical protein